MNKFLLILKVQLLSLFSRSSNASGKKKNGIARASSPTGYILLYAFLFAIMGFYEYMIMSVLALIGSADVVITLCAFSSSALSVFTAMGAVKMLVFCPKDFDESMTWPVSSRMLTTAKITTLYLYDLISTSMFMFPCGIVYGILTSPSALFYVVYYTICLFLPLIPIAIGSLLGAVFSYISSRFKHANIAGTVLYVAFFVLVMFGSFSMSGMSEEDFAQIGQLGDTFSNIYPMVKLFSKACLEFSVTSYILFAATSLAVFAVIAFVFGTLYKSFHSAFATHYTSSKYKMSGSRTSPTGAIIKKELGKFISSPILLVNSAAGILISLIGIVFIVIKLPDVMNSENGELFGYIIGMLAPFVLGILACMSCTTNSCISLEAKTLGILKTAPVSSRCVLFSKLYSHMLLCFPVLIIDSAVLAFIVKPGIIDTILLFTVPLLYSFLVGLVGLFMNLKRYSFSWTNEIYVVKQSMPVFVTMFGGMIVSMIPTVLLFVLMSANVNYLVVSVSSAVILALTCAILTGILYKKADKLFTAVQ